MIYLDHNATTPLAPTAFEAMTPYLTARYGNPSSAHSAGRTARAAVVAARQRVGDFLGAGADEVVFTASGSEGNNLAIRGAALARRDAGRDTIVTQSTEHPSVLATCRALHRIHGLRVLVVGVDANGVVNLDELRAAVDRRTAIVSIQLANGETGTLQPVGEVADIARRRGALAHADACQGAGKVPVDVRDLGVDLLTVAGHKMYGPPGIGALYRRAGTVLEPLVHGGEQESGLRAATENVPGVVGLAAACDVADQAASDGGRVRLMRDTLFDALRSGLRERVHLNGHATRRLPNTLNVSVEGADGRAVLAAAEGLAASTGSACHAGNDEPSAVLTAMGCPRDLALGAIRLSLGPTTQADEIRRAVYLLARATGDREAPRYAVH